MSSTITKPNYEIKGQPLFDTPEIFQLGKDDSGLGKDAVKLMNERFGNHRYLKVTVPNDNQPIQGSNPYIRFALGPIVRELYGKDIRLISPQVSEIVLCSGKPPDVTTYEDLGVVVYSLDGANGQLAKHLAGQAKERGIEVKFPMVFYGLKTAKDDKVSYGLRLDLDDITVAYHVPILSKDTGKFKSDDKNLIQNGFPSELGEGDWSLFTARDGLRRLGRSGLNLSASDGILPYSNETGRVSFVKGAATQSLEEKLAELKLKKREQITEVEARYIEALEIMKGQ